MKSVIFFAILAALTFCPALTAGKKKNGPQNLLLNPDYNNDLKVAGSEMIYWMRHISKAFDHAMFKDDRQVKLLYRAIADIDKNHNFKLEREEKEALKNHMRSLFDDVHAKILDEFDSNNNSRLDSRELIAARSSFKSFTTPLYKNLETRYSSGMPDDKNKKKKKKKKNDN